MHRDLVLYVYIVQNYSCLEFELTALLSMVTWLHQPNKRDLIIVENTYKAAYSHRVQAYNTQFQQLLADQEQLISGMIREDP